MGLRERILADTKEAMKAKETARLSTLRLISAAIKDREIAARGEGGDEAGLSEADLTAILSKMVKQRQESAKAYEEGGRLELAEREQDEIKVIQSYLPRQLDAEETRAAIDKAIADLGAEFDPRHGPGHGRAARPLCRADGFRRSRAGDQGSVDEMTA